MNRTCKTCIFLALLSLYALPVRCGDPAEERKWAIRGGKVVTITKGNLEGAVVLVSGGRIEKVIPSPGDACKHECMHGHCLLYTSDAADE